MENDQVTLLERVLQFALERYGTPPEYLWRTAPAYAVLRRTDSRKWYGVVMDVPRARLGLPGQGKVDILNVKCDPILAASLRGEDGFLPAYHMNRDSWLSVQLDGTVGEETLFSLLADSYRLVGQKPPKAAPPTWPRCWLAPANYRYFDLEAAFAVSPLLDWKQTAHIAAGDTVCIYMGAPVSAVRYRCEVVQADLPGRQQEGKVCVRRRMTLRLVQTYPPDAFPLARLQSEYGVGAVRSQRGMPPSLARALGCV